MAFVWLVVWVVVMGLGVEGRALKGRGCSGRGGERVIHAGCFEIGCLLYPVAVHGVGRVGRGEGGGDFPECSVLCSVSLLREVGGSF